MDGAGEQRRRILADHLFDDPGNRDVGGAGRLHQLAIAQHGDVIADLQEFIQLVRDVNDGDAAALQLVDHAEEHFNLGVAQGRGWLIHDQDANILRQRPGNFDDLLLADAQVADRGIRLDILFQPPHELASVFFLGFPVDGHATGDFTRQVDVFNHAQVRAQGHFLEDDADPLRGCLPDVVQVDFFVFQEDVARGRLLHAGQDLHQGRFPGAVFAHEDVDLAVVDVETDVVQREGAGVDLGDVLRSEHNPVGACRLASLGR